MSALKRMLSIGREKKQQTPPVRDVEAIKRSISRPQALAPKHIIDEQIRARKAARLEAEAREHETLAAQPSPATTQRRHKASQGAFKKHLKVVFADNSKASTTSPTNGNADVVKDGPHKRDNGITIILNRKSAASSFWCCGPNEQDLSEQAQPSNNITESMEDGPTIGFRNEEERQRAYRVLATLRESVHNNEEAEAATPRCGRDCSQCLEKMAHRRHPSEYRDLPSNLVPQIFVYVTDDPEDPEAWEQPSTRASETDISDFIADELEFEFDEWRASRVY